MRDAAAVSLRVIERPPRSWQGLVETVLTITTVAEIDGRVVAEARAEIAGGPDDRHAWLDHLWVATECRGRGIARQLVTSLIAELRARGAVDVFTLVHRSDVSLAPFFGELGFRERPFACLGRSLA